MDFEGFLKDNWAVIVANPVTFILFGLIVFGVSFAFGRGSVATQVANKQSELDLANARVGDYERKLSGASPDEALAKIQELKEQIATLASYGLSKGAESRLRDAIAGHPAKIAINRTLEASDADRLYRQVISAFKGAGWDVAHSGTVWSLSGKQPDSGVTLLTWSSVPADLIARVSFALNVAGLDVDVRHDLPASQDMGFPQIIFSSRDPDYQSPGRWK